MALHSLPYYLPIAPTCAIVIAIIGIGLWVHYAQEAYNQSVYALEVLGPAVTAPELDRVQQAITGTSVSYCIFGCALFGICLWRKLLAVECDKQGHPNAQTGVYASVNLVLHIFWWMVMVWMVLCMMGMSVFLILVWAGHGAVLQVVRNQGPALPPPASGAAPAPGTSNGALLDVVQGIVSADFCPTKCLNLSLFPIVVVPPQDACVCDRATLDIVLQAASKALDCAPGIMVGLWLMYICGDVLRMSLASDFTHSLRDLDPELAPTGPGGSKRYSRM